MVADGDGGVVLFRPVQHAPACHTGLLERGILKGAQKYYPSAVHTDEDVEKTIQAMREVVPVIQA